MRIVVLSLFVVLISPALLADDFYIDVADGGSDNLGTFAEPWNGAEAINDRWGEVAAMPPPALGVHVIHVAPGIYERAARTDPADNDVKIIADRWNGASGDVVISPTVSPPGYGGPGIKICNGCTSATIIDGIIVDGEWYDGSSTLGAFAILGTEDTFAPIEGSSPTIRNCTIKNNNRNGFANNYAGAGMLIGPACHPTIDNCTIDNNTTESFAGGMWIYGSLKVNDPALEEYKPNPIIRNVTVRPSHLPGVRGA